MTHKGDHVLGVPLFHFVHADGKKAGQPGVPQGRATRHEGDVYHMENGSSFRAHRPLYYWPAVVRDGGGFLYLEIPHPNGMATLEYRLDGPNPVRYDPNKGSHTWHLPE